MARRDGTNGNGAATVARRGGTIHNAMVAAASRIKLDDRKAAKKQAARRQEWQDEAWDYFDDVPEIKYATWFLGNAMSKLRIFAAIRPTPDGEPVPLDDPDSGVPIGVAQRAAAELARLRSPLGGQGQMLRQLNMNLEIAAEAYLVGYGPRVEVERDLVTGEEVEVIVPEEWNVRSVSEVTQKDGRYAIVDGPGAPERPLDPDNDTIIRIWQQHPRYSRLPDCNMRGVLSDCEALLLLTNQVKAEAKSKQSAGILTVPNELSFGPPDATQPEDGEEAAGDPFIEELMTALTDPIDDPASAAAVMPLVIRGPGEMLKADYLRHINLSRETTEVLESRIAARIDRIARGLNLPVEVVMGHMATTYANAEQVDEDTYEDHLEPRCVLLVDALAVGFLQPQLVDAGLDPDLASQIIVWFDPAALIGKTDPKESADKGVELGLVSGEAWRRVKGFDEADAPDDAEVEARRQWNASTSAPPVAAIQWAAPSAPELLAAAPVAVAELPAAPTNVGRRLMDLDRDLRAKLLVAADRAMARTLERAGNRLKSRAPAEMKALVKSVHPRFVAAHLGPSLVAQAGIPEVELVTDEAWVELEGQFMAWGASAQAEAIDLASRIAGGFSTAEREALGLRQAADLGEAWSWMHEALTTLAHVRLYGPDPHAAGLGEFDPTSSVPTGLVRQALARAGGATGITNEGHGNAYVALSNDLPLGGIGTGELLMGSLRDHGAGVEAYEWVYGPAYRARPFEEHEALDGLVFAEFDGADLSNDAHSWLPTTYYFPGDHDGCACDVSPVIVGPND